MKWGKPCIVFTGFRSNDEQLELVAKIEKLGGNYLTDFHKSCTHIICPKPVRTEKFLIGCATGKWILTPQFIEDSFSNKHWLKEDKYEWNEDMLPPSPSKPLKDLFAAPRRNRKRFKANGSRGLFKDWIVALLMKNPSNKKVYKRILTFGGAKLYSTYLPVMKPKLLVSEVTHIIIEQETASTIKNLLKYNAVCIYTDYIRNCILQEFIPDPEDFQLGFYEPDTDIYCCLSRSFTNSPKMIPSVPRVPYTCADKLMKGTPKRGLRATPYNTYNTRSQAKKKVEVHGPLDEFLKYGRINKTKRDLFSEKENINSELMKHNKEEKNDIQLSTDKKTLSDGIDYSRKRDNIEPLKPAKRIRLSKRNCIRVLFDNKDVAYDKENKLEREICMKKSCWHFQVKRRSSLIYRSATESPIYQSQKQDHEICPVELPERYFYFFEAHIQEDSWYSATEFMQLLLSPHILPHPKIIHHLLLKLTNSPDDHIRNRIYRLLICILHLHPCINYSSRQWYSKCLGADNPDNAWNMIIEVVENNLIVQDVHTKVKSSAWLNHNFLFLDYLLTLLDMDFLSFSLSANPEHNIRFANHQPLLVQIIWSLNERSNLFLNTACCQIMKASVKSVANKANFETAKNLFRLCTMVIECLSLSESEEFPIKSQMAIENLTFLIKEANLDGEGLSLILSLIEVPWIKLKLAQCLLDNLYKPIHQKEIKQENFLSLYTILTSYMSLYPVKKPSPREPKDSAADLNGKKKLRRWRHPLNWKNMRGETELHVACMKNNVELLYELLSKPGIEVNVQDNVGWTPLHEACNYGHVECVRALLNHQSGNNIVDIDIKSSSGITPLHDAVISNRIAVVELLLEYGGSGLLKTQTSEGATALSLATTSEMKSLLQNFESPTKKQFQPADFSDLERYVILVQHLVSSYMSCQSLAKELLEKEAPQSNCGKSKDFLWLEEDQRILKEADGYLTAFNQHLIQMSNRSCVDKLYLQLLTISLHLHQ